MKINTKEWLPLKLAAKHAGVSERTIVTWYLSGLVSAVDPWNRERLYNVKDLDKCKNGIRGLTRGKRKA